MRMSESEYNHVYDGVPITTLEDNGFPINFNLLTHQQLTLFATIVDLTVNRYSDGYIELLESFREDLSSLSTQAKEVIDELGS